MAEKVVSVRLQAHVEGFTAGMRKAKASVDDLTKADVPKAAKGYTDLANKAALAGVAVATGLGVAVKRFADFDQAMSAVKANTGGTVKEMESLRDAAIKLGAASQFSATEAAQGINELAKAGISTADILSGGLKGSLDLAAAGQISVADAAETTATALTQFKLSGDKATHVADLLANGANKAQGGVSDLGQALAQAGLVAASTGLSIEETTGGLTAFASAGLLGSDAGTSMKTMLQRLSAPVGEAAVMLDKLGISAYDNKGNFVGLADVAGQLQRTMKDMTPEVRNNALAVIFGSDAVRAANVLYDQGAEGIGQWTAEVSASGAAAAQAAAQTDNLKGDIERLGGAFDSVLIGTGSGANESLRSLTQSLTGLITEVGKVPAPLLLIGGGLTAMVLVLPKAVGAFKAFGASVQAIGFDGPRAAKGLNMMTTAAKAYAKALAAAAVVGAANEMFTQDAGALGVEQLTKDLTNSTNAVDTFSKAINDNAAYISATEDSLSSFGDVLQVTFDPSFFQNFNAKGSDAVKALTLGMVDLNNVSDEAAQRMGDLDGVLSRLVASGDTKRAADLFNQFAAAGAKQGVSVDELKAKLPGYGEALAAVDNASKNATGSSGLLAGATDDLADKAVSAEDALKALQEQIDGLGSPFAKQRAAARAFNDSVRAAGDAVEQYGAKGDQTGKQIKEFGKITLTAAGDIDTSTEAGSALSASLDGIRDSALDNVNASFEAAGGIDNLAASTKAGTAAMKEGHDAFVEAATAAGLTNTQAEKLATQLGLIPGNVKIAVSQSGAEAAGAAIDNAAKNRTTIITVKQRFADAAAARENLANQQDFGNVRKAQGGAIYGAGTGTSDSIAAYLSNGEHVLTAAEVAKMGGQSAVYAMRAAIRAGRMPGFAAGGAVTNYAPPVHYGGPTSYATTNDSRLMADTVNFYDSDARSFKREFRTTSYRAKSKPGRNS